MYRRGLINVKGPCGTHETDVKIDINNKCVVYTHLTHFPAALYQGRYNIKNLYFQITNDID